VYGVLTPQDQVPESTTGRQGRPLETLDHGGLRVVYSRVDPDGPVSRSDLLAHAHALEAIAEDGNVVPLRFGTVLPDLDTVRRDLVEARCDELLAMLGHFDGLVQVSLVCDLVENEALQEVMRRRPELVARRDQARPAPGAVRQAEQVRLGETVARHLEDLRAELGNRAVDRVAPYVRAVALHEGAGALQAANASFLVEREKRTLLDAEVGALREDLAPLAEVRYVGPQPPFAFLSALEESGRRAPWD
jgi:hypothetical protein